MASVSTYLADILGNCSRTMTLLVLAMGLAACGLIKTEPGTAGIREAMQGGYRYARSREGLDHRVPFTSGQFWAEFRSPELAALVAQAEQGSQNVAAAAARLRQAEAQADQARTLMFPVGGLAASSTSFRPSATMAAQNSGIPADRLPTLQSLRQQQAVLSASYELDIWGKNTATWRAAEHNSLATSYDLDAIRLSVTARVAFAYLDILATRDRLRFVQEAVRVAKQVESNIRERVTAGSATEIDLAQQQTIVEQQAAAIPRLTRSLELSEISLAALLGVAPGNVVIRVSSLTRLSLPSPPAGLPTDLLRRRPDLREVEEQVLAAAENVTQAKAAMLPSITIAGQKGFQSPMWSTLFFPQSEIFQVVGGVAQPILDAPRLAAQLDERDFRREELVANYKQVILTSLADVESAFVAARTSTNEQARLTAAVNAAKRAYDLSREQLEAGQIDVTTVLNTQRVYFEAVDTLQQVRLARFQAAVSLYQAIGGGWTPDDERQARTAWLRFPGCRSEQACGGVAQSHSSTPAPSETR